MPDLLPAVLESWDRQADIVNRLAAQIEEGDLDFRAGSGEGTIAYHLCHIHECRWFWLSKVSKKYAERLGDLFPDGQPIHDLTTIRAEIKKSGEAIGAAMAELLPVGEPGINYTHPIHFMQHMLWHDGWHVGVIVLTLRQNGHEPTDAWMEENMWGVWRYEEPWVPPTEG